MSLQRLCNNLREIIAINQSIYKLAAEKKDVLIRGDIDTLAKIVQQEGELIKAMSKRESERQQCVQDVISVYRVESSDEIRLTDLLEHLPSSSEKEELSHLFMELSAQLSDLQTLNELNQQMIENSLEFVNYSIELFTEMPEEQVYQKPVSRETSANPYQRRSIFDTKA